MDSIDRLVEPLQPLTALEMAEVERFRQMPDGEERAAWYTRGKLRGRRRKVC